MDPHTNADGFITNTDNSDDAAQKPLAWRNAWQDADMNAAVAAAASERDEDTRKQDYIDLQKKLLDEGPYIIMFQADHRSWRTVRTCRATSRARRPT